MRPACVEVSGFEPPTSTLRTYCSVVRDAALTCRFPLDARTYRSFVPVPCPIEIVTPLWYDYCVSDGDPLPDEIALTRDEAADILFALDAAMDAAAAGPLYERLEYAAQILIEKFMPDLRDL
jgi:hypothetical protein